MIVHTFSDYSAKKKRGAYAHLAFDVSEEVRVISQGGAVVPKNIQVHVGEAIACLSAMKRVPDGADVVVHCDINWMDKLLTGGTARSRVQQQMGNQIEQFLRHRERFSSVKFVALKRKSKPWAHHWCHRKARSLIGIGSEPKNLLQIIAGMELQFYV